MPEYKRYHDVMPDVPTQDLWTSTSRSHRGRALPNGAAYPSAQKPDGAPEPGILVGQQRRRPTGPGPRFAGAAYTLWCRTAANELGRRWHRCPICRTWRSASRAASSACAHVHHGDRIDRDVRRRGEPVRAPCRMPKRSRRLRHRQFRLGPHWSDAGAWRLNFVRRGASTTADADGRRLARPADGRPLRLSRQRRGWSDCQYFG